MSKYFRIAKNIFARKEVVISARAWYNRDMKPQKIMGIFAAAVLGAGALGGGLSFPLPVNAEETPVSLTQENAELFLPTSYEQYLNLENPTYVAMNEEHIAIADGSSVYVYSVKDERYSLYKHSASDGQDTVSKIQFTDGGEMFFRDTGNRLYRYDFETQSSKIIDNISCQTFLIHGDYLYIANETTTANLSGFSYVPVNGEELDYKNVKPLTGDIVAFNPRMAFANGILYCIINNNTVNAYDGETHNFIVSGKLDSSREQINNLQFVSAYGDDFFYSVNGAGNPENGLYRTDSGGNSVCIQKGDGFSSISSYGGKLFCIQGQSVRELSVDGEKVAFSDYEISSASSSRNRLSAAGETARANNLVAIADAGNGRISVYNRMSGNYTIIECKDGSGTSYLPEHVAIDKEERTFKANGDVITTNKIAVSCGKKICVYTLSRHSDPSKADDAELTQEKEAPQSIVGLSFVYGECYYITEYNGYGVLSEDSSTELHFSIIGTPSAIASDLYGALYVAFGNKIYKFSEADFHADRANGTELISLSGDSANVYISLSVDYEGNVWHLTKDGTLYCNNREAANVDGKDFVYLKEDHDYPVSFALAFVDDEVYFNFGNYVVKTKPFALSRLAALNKIAAGEAKEETFRLASRDNLFVKIPSGTVGVRIDLNALKTDESEYFPYESYFRTEYEENGEFRRGVLLYEPANDDGCYVVALYEEDRHTFTANLFKKSRCAIVPDEDYFKDANENFFVTSDVALCSAPCLFPAPEGERLSVLSDTLLVRGTELNVLGYADGEDRVYAFVEIKEEGREAKRGYLPRSYLTKTNPLGTQGKTYTLGHIKGDAGVVLISDSGSELAITEKTAARFYRNEDGTYTAVVVKDGVSYSATISEKAISRGETDALRISLIVILSVLALVIIASYAFLVFPIRKKKKL